MTAHNNLHALLFQTSAEYVALCVQAYQLARHSLLRRLESGTFRQPAVVFDLDETVLDNSAYQAWQLTTGSNYHDTSWNRWCNAVQAELVPGALEFIRFVEDADVTPIFVTSRLHKFTRAATLENLAKLGVISQGDLKNETHWAADRDKTVLPKYTRLFMKGMDAVNVPAVSGGQSGREWPMANKFDHRTWVTGYRGHEIILSVGDNLGDYAEYYGRVYDKDVWKFYEKDERAKGEIVQIEVDGKIAEGLDHKPLLDRGKHPTVGERHNSVLQDSSLFGRDFILIPNPTYGGWLRAFEDNRRGAADEQYFTPEPVRQPLAEAPTSFAYPNPKAGQPGEESEIIKISTGPKLAESRQLRIWDGKDRTAKGPTTSQDPTNA